MPNIHGQVTRKDFKAPAGKYRIIREEMSDGELSIVGDFNLYEFAALGLESARAAHPDDVFTLCDEYDIIDPKPAANTKAGALQQAKEEVCREADMNRVDDDRFCDRD